MTLHEAVDEAAERLSGDVYLREDARRDAELLLLDAAGVTRAQFLARPDRLLTDEEQARYRGSIARRLGYEPVQYITGRQEFYGLDLRVTPAVLIPRPETELLVEAVLTYFKARACGRRIADIGTGSGAIAIALAVHLPEAEIVATDISPEALAVAEANAVEHGVGGRVRFVQTDLLALPIGGPHHAQSVQSGLFQHFDAVVSNPPYVPEGEAAELHPQVREHEPAGALFAGPSGLEVYRRLIPQAHEALRSGGLLALEIGHGQREAVGALLADWRNVRFLDDLQRIPRAALAET